MTGRSEDIGGTAASSGADHSVNNLLFVAKLVMAIVFPGVEV